MSQLNLGDKVRLLYDQLKDIKYTLATVADMSNKPLGQYGEVIANSIGKHASKTAGNTKIQSTPVEMRVDYDDSIKPTGISAVFHRHGVEASPVGIYARTHVDEVNPVLANATFVGSIGSVEIQPDIVPVTLDDGDTATPTFMSGTHVVEMDVIPTEIVQENTNFIKEE